MRQEPQEKYADDTDSQGEESSRNSIVRLIAQVQGYQNEDASNRAEWAG